MTSVNPPAYPAEYYSADRATAYKDAGWWLDENFAEFFQAMSEKFPANEAAVARSCRGEYFRLSYSELLDYGAGVALQLRDAGVEPGERVLLHFPNTIEYVGAVVGAFLAGCVPVFSILAHGPRDLAHFVHNGKASAFLSPERFGLQDFAARFVQIQEQSSAIAANGGFGDTPGIDAFDSTEGILPGDVQHIQIADPGAYTSSYADLPDFGRRDPFGLAFLQLSGGTTGIPKLIARTHADYLYSVRASAEICELDEQSKMLVVVPASHNFSMSSPGILGVWFAGGTVFLHADPTPSSAFALIATEGITLAPLVPPLLMSWLNTAQPETREQLRSMRYIQVGGAKLLPEAAARVEAELGTGLQQVFGMAEGLVCYTRLDDPTEVILHTQGRPISAGDEIRILDDAGNPVAENTPGNLWTRGPYTIVGYANGADASSFADSWYCTGDIVRMRPDGNVVVEGRAKDQINRAGEKIAPDEVENILLRLPYVRDAVVIGLPDPVLGERSCAVLLCDDTSLYSQRNAEVRAFVHESGLADYKVPDDLHWVEEFPATAVGKISRKELRRVLQKHVQNKDS